MRSRTPTRRAFTATELLIVLLIIGLLLALLMGGMAVLGVKSDQYNTSNTIIAVHNAMRRCAMQFGSGGAVYGYAVSGQFNKGYGWKEAGVAPFAVTAPAAVGGGNGLILNSADLRTEIAPGFVFWHQDYFIQLSRVGGLAENQDRYMPNHTYVVLFAPRTGTVHRNVMQDGLPVWPGMKENDNNRTEAGSLWYPENCIRLAQLESGLFQRLSGGAPQVYPPGRYGWAQSDTATVLGHYIPLYNPSGIQTYAMEAGAMGSIRVVRTR